MLRISPKLPEVSVIIPVYNQEKYIKECVDSVIDQDYDMLEIIVIDDGSIDRTPEILKSYMEKIIYIRQENQGPSASVNNGIKASKGSLICWLGSDDVYMPEKIESQVEFFFNNPEISVVYSDYIMIDSDGKELNKIQVPYPLYEQFARSLLIRNFINGSTVMMKRECIDRVGYYDESLKADPDGDMWFRMIKYGYKFGHIAKPLIKYRWHSNNVSHNIDLMRKCKDKVRLKVIQEFTPQELFSDNLSDKNFIKKSYEDIAVNLFLNFNFESAETALLKAYELGNKNF